jgi:hypothetical protein
VSTQQIQEERKGQAILEAAQAIERAKPDTPHLDAAMGEILAPDEYRIAALVAELAEMVVRQERAIDHIADHVVAAQDTEIRALKKRVEELENAAAAAAPSSAEASGEAKKKQ